VPLLAAVLRSALTSGCFGWCPWQLLPMVADSLASQLAVAGSRVLRLVAAEQSALRLVMVTARNAQVALESGKAALETDCSR